MPFTTWIRDLFGIRKDVVDTKKAQLEITKLEDEEDERRGLIQLATLDDVKKYDPNIQKLQLKIDERKLGKGVVEPVADLVRRYPNTAAVFILIAILVFIVLGVRSCLNLFR